MKKQILASVSASVILLASCIVAPAPAFRAAHSHRAPAPRMATAPAAAPAFVGPVLIQTPAPTLLHNWLTTAYSYREVGHKAYGHLNSMGHSLTAMVEGCRQIAADWHFLPRGSIVVIPKIGKCIVTDCGSAVTGQHIDIHFISLADMKDRGSVVTDIKVLRWGWAPSSMMASR